MDTHEDLKKAIATEEAALAEAHDRLSKAEGAVLLAEGRFLDSPDDAHGSAVTDAKANVEKAQAVVDAREKRAQRARDALTVAEQARDRDELQRLQISLARHDYADELAAAERFDRQLEEMVMEPLAAKNAARLRTWTRAAEIARRLGDVSFVSRCPRPTSNEAIVLARIVIAKGRAANGRGESKVPELMSGWDRPAWNDKNVEVYRAALSVLENGVKP